MRSKMTVKNAVGSNRRSATIGIAGTLAILGLCTLIGCDGVWFVSRPGDVDLEKFISQTAFKRYLADRVDAERSRWRNFYGEDAMMFDMAAGPTGGADGVAAPAAESAGGAGEGGFSTTNIQEEGVDESDVVKNDGTYLYVLSGDQLTIVRAVPADEMEVVSTFTLPEQADTLYLRGDTVVAVGNRSAYYQREPWDIALGGMDSYGGQGGSAVTILDVTDRSSPSVTATFVAEASLTTSRMIGSKLHLVLSAWPNLPDTPDDISLLLGDPIIYADVNDLIPNLTVTLADGQSVKQDLVAWEDFYYPVDPDGYEVTAVVTIDVDAPDEPFESVGVLANAGIVYVSTKALYLTDTEYDSLGETRETTDIYKFTFQPDGAEWTGAGSIPGRLLNRFSLGESKGYLRAATTIGNVWRSGDNTATNNIYVLGEENGDLTVVGRIEGIAPGERIYSARFVGDRGFLVTFKKVDPLFTFDLSDPANPEVVGELKVPGYSDYIHPLGENHLLTIGKDAVDVGDFAWYQGVQISVFDVTDFADPQRVDVEIVGDRGTDSEALHNPHAFNYFARQNILAVPMVIAEVPESEAEQPSARGDAVFAGLCLYRITTDEGVDPIAQIPTGSEDNIYRYWGAWTRGIFIGDYIYAVTDSAVQAARLNDPTAPLLELPLE